MWVQGHVQSERQQVVFHAPLAQTFTEPAFGRRKPLAGRRRQDLLDGSWEVAGGEFADGLCEVLTDVMKVADEAVDFVPL